MSRFVLLRHELPPGSPRPSHWDLMLEHDGVLWAWAIESLPGPWLAATEGESPGDSSVRSRPAMRLADHRMAYLDYEGPVSDGRGEVKRVDRGEYLMLAASAEQVEVQLAGEKIRGGVRLRQVVAESWRIELV